MKEQIANAVGELAAIPYFPTDEHARRAVMREISKFVDSMDRLRWLVGAALNSMRQWEGIGELRGLYCTKFKPADGIEVDCHLPGYSANECEAQHAVEGGTRAALSTAIMAELGSGSMVNPVGPKEPLEAARGPKLDRTTAALRIRQTAEKLSRIGGADPKPRPIHIPATRTRTPEERAAAVLELEAQLAERVPGEPGREPDEVRQGGCSHVTQKIGSF